MARWSFSRELSLSFAETKDLIAGYWLWQVKSKKEAIEWVKRCPNPHHEGGEIETRQVFEAEDFGAEFTPHLLECDLLLNIVTILRRTVTDDRRSGMTGLARGLLGRDSSIARDRIATGALSTDRCLRCSGFTVARCDNVVGNLACGA
jgi:hypothetical protein